jgi:hypothetical protein
MNYNLKYLKYKQKYLQLKGGASNNIILNDINLMKYSIYFDNYQVVIYGEHHFNHDYSNFVMNFKSFLQSSCNKNKKYVIILEVDEDLLNNNASNNETSISHLLCKAYINKEFENCTNITFIAGNNRTDNFQNILINLKNNRIIDIHSIKLYWEYEKNRFEGEEYNIYKKNIDNLLTDLKNKKYKDLNILLDQLWFYWCRISNIYVLNKIKNYMDKDYNIIFITDKLHFFDYIYLINKKYKSVSQYICNTYKITNHNLKFLFSQTPYWGEKFDNFYCCKFY